MAFDFTQIPQFPNVPPLPGVPPLFASPRGVINLLGGGAALMTADSLFGAGFFGQQQWGIIDSQGNAVAMFDNVVSVEYRHEMNISNFPVEQGAFQSYNKVQVPWDCRVKFSTGQDVETRAAFLNAIEVAVLSLGFYAVLTPEAQYPSANLIHMEYERSQQRGNNLLIVDVWLQEVRATAQAQNVASQPTVNTPAADSAAPANTNGTTQAINVTATPEQNTPLPMVGGGMTPDTTVSDVPTLGGSVPPMPDLGTTTSTPLPTSLIPSNMPG